MRYLLVLIATLLICAIPHAQVSIKLYFNVSSQPVWGPTGHDHVEYYYLPDIEAYYSVPQHRFFYNEGGQWVSRPQLPTRYHDYDLYRSYKVVLNQKEPYLNHKKYRDQYSSYKGRRDQPLIRDSRDSKYFVIINHPEHNNWLKQQNHHHGNGGGNGRDSNQDKGQGQDESEDINK